MAWMRPIFKGDVVVIRRVTVAQIESMRDIDHSFGHGMLRHCQEPQIDSSAEDRRLGLVQGRQECERDGGFDGTRRAV